MADNVILNAGAGGATLATDDIAGTHYQIIKLAHGALDTATLVSTASGLPVQKQGTWDITNAGVFVVQEDGAALTALQLADDVVHALNDTLNKAAAVGGQLDDVAPVVATEGNVAPTRITAQRAFHVNLRDVAGAELGIAAAPLRTDPTGTTTQPINLNQVGGVAVVTGGVAGSQGVGGLAADGAVVAGNPVLVAGSDGTNAETILVTAAGRQVFMSSSAAADASSNSVASPTVSATLSFKQAVSNFVFNGATWDRMRGSVDGLHVNPRAIATGGASFFKSIDLDETEEEVKAAAATLYGAAVFNLTDTPLFFKVYNATAATVVVGTTIPDLTFVVPGNVDSDGAGFTLPIPDQGVAFGTALTIACTTGIGDADAGAPGLNACVVALFYA